MAHLLPDCIHSILKQSFADFEILIMDDCSPDSTPEVAATFGDPRVMHVRNEVNLGHLRNYNKGIELARGRFVWLISADDYLRTKSILARYMKCFEKNPSVGYVFCSGYAVRDGVETKVLGRYRERLDRDRILPGRRFLKKLLNGNFVLAPSGLVRRECYDRLGTFPTDLPFAGDWYLWCRFAIHWNVGYFAEPMVCYRDHHSLSMTTALLTGKLEGCAAEEIAIAWDIVGEVLRAGYPSLAKQLLPAVAQAYARTLARERFESCSSFMNFERLEEALKERLPDKVQRALFRARAYAAVGNEFYWRGQRDSAKSFYASALRVNPWMPVIQLKRMLLGLGRIGDAARAALLALR